MKTRVSSFALVLTLALTMLTGCSDIIKFMSSFQDKAKRPSQPTNASAMIGTTRVSVDYGQPVKNGREIFGKLVPYGEVWRTGANEATEISFDKDVIIAGKSLKAGRYQLFTIPQPDKWTIIFNSKLGQWGAFFYDEKSNVLMVDVATSTNDTVIEKLTIQLESASSALSIAWDKTKVVVPITAP